MAMKCPQCGHEIPGPEYVTSNKCPNCGWVDKCPKCGAVPAGTNKACDICVEIASDIGLNLDQLEAGS